MNNTDALKNIRIVLARPSHPGNIGAAARAMKTMGLDDLRLIEPRAFPHADAARRATGATDVLERARVHATLAEALDGCVLAVATSGRHREFRHEMMDAREAARAAIAVADRPVAFVFGNETAGLSAAEAADCRIWAAIPADDGFGSLNLAAAVQVFAYELRMACGEAAPPAPPEFAAATLEQVDQVATRLLARMADSGYYDPAQPGHLELRLRRLLGRARLEVEEIKILRGFLKSLERDGGR